MTEAADFDPRPLAFRTGIIFPGSMALADAAVEPVVVLAGTLSAVNAITDWKAEPWGTWDFGPFDNDSAADFANDLDDASEAERVALIRGVLTAAVENNTYLDSSEGAPAIAAAALVACRLPGGEQFAPNVYGPEAPIPDLPANLLPLAIGAIDRVLAANSELASLWSESTRTEGPWRTSLLQLKSVLLNATTDGMDPLFEAAP